MSHTRRLVALTAAVGLVCAVGVATGSTPALAAGQQQICSTAWGPDLCLNDWNNAGVGNGNVIKMYSPNASHEDFQSQKLTGRCANGMVTTTCPFADHNIDAQYAGDHDPIVQLTYGGFASGECVATDGHNNAVLGYCNNYRSGVGGSAGTVFVLDHGMLISLYWTNREDLPVCLTPGQSTGSPAGFPLSFACFAWTGDVPPAGS